MVSKSLGISKLEHLSYILLIKIVTCKELSLKGQDNRRLRWVILRFYSPIQSQKYKDEIQIILSSSESPFPDQRIWKLHSF
jgi:hypothetical protein